MAAYTALTLSGAGAPTAVPIGGVVLHSCPAAPAMDEVYLVAANVAAVSARLIVTVGGMTALDLILPANSLPVTVLPGVRVSGAVVAADSDVTGAIRITGWINRIAP